MKHSNSIMYGAIIYSLFVGAVYSSFAIIGLLTRWCVLETQSSPLLYMFYLFYYRVDSCEPKIQWRKFNIITETNVSMPYETQAVSRTYIFTIIYLALHVALIAFALLALCGIKCSVNRKHYPLFFSPLVLILIVTVVFDVVATVYYVIDFINVMKKDGLMNILEVRNQADTRNNFEQLPYTARYLPPIAMFCYTSKLLFFLICNIVWAVTIVHISFSNSKESDNFAVVNLRNNYNDAILANDNPAFEDDKNDGLSPRHEQNGTTENRYNDTSREQGFVYPHQLYAKRNKKKNDGDETLDDDSIDFKIQRPILTASYYGNGRHSKNHQFHSNDTYDPEVENRLSRFQKSNENLEYDEITTEISYKEMKFRPTPPPKPNRPSSVYYLNSTGHEDSVIHRPYSGLSDTNGDRSSGHIRTPQELRSQLPWSYFKSGDEVPRHALVHVDDNELPGTPLPDYDVSVTKRRYNSDGY